MQKGRHTAIIATCKYTNTTEQWKQSLKSEWAKPKRCCSRVYISLLLPRHWAVSSEGLGGQKVLVLYLGYNWVACSHPAFTLAACQLKLTPMTKWLGEVKLVGDRIQTKTSNFHPNPSHFRSETTFNSAGIYDGVYPVHKRSITEQRWFCFEMTHLSSS